MSSKTGRYCGCSFLGELGKAILAILLFAEAKSEEGERGKSESKALLLFFKVEDD